MFVVNAEGKAERVPYTSADGRHRHRCDNGHIWEHGDQNSGNDAAHHCPKCGAESEASFFGWARYHGPEAPEVSCA